MFLRSLAPASGLLAILPRASTRLARVYPLEGGRGVLKVLRATAASSFVPRPVRAGTLRRRPSLPRGLCAAFKAMLRLAPTVFVRHIPRFSWAVITQRLSGRRLGLLINFNVALIKDGIRRIVNGLPE